MNQLLFLYTMPFLIPFNQLLWAIFKTLTFSDVNSIPWIFYNVLEILYSILFITVLHTFFNFTERNGFNKNILVVKNQYETR